MYDPADPLREVDLFATHPIPLPELLSRAARVRLAGCDVPVASIDDLIAMKRQAGRPQDLADVAALLAVQARSGTDDA